MDRRDFGRAVLATAAGTVLGAVGCMAPPEETARNSRGRVPVTGRGLRARTVSSVVAARNTLEGAGFPVRRPFPTAALALMDPFVLLDEMGPVDWPPGEAKGAPDHPHRGFETVTYVLQGAVQHRDSFGGRGRIGPGGVQWMTAGSGIVHSEMPPDEMLAQGGWMHAFQLWVNLPARAKWIAPRYQDLSQREMPTGGTDDGRAVAKVIAGEALGARASIETHTPMVFQHWSLRPGARVEQRLPRDHSVCAFVFGGACVLGEEARSAREGDLVIFGDGDTVRLASAGENAEILLLAGVPLREPVARRGPFVMNTDDEIRQAYEDYRSGRMGRITG